MHLALPGVPLDRRPCLRLSDYGLDLLYTVPRSLSPAIAKDRRLPNQLLSPYVNAIASN